MNLGAVVPQETAVLPLGSAVLPLPSAVLPHRMKGKGKEGTGRYYRGGRAVLPLRSGTAACHSSAVLPLGTTVLPLGPRQDTTERKDLSIEVEEL